MQYIKKFIYLFLLFIISCAEITDVFPPLISAEQVNGVFKLTVKDDEGIEKVTIQIKNTSWDNIVWDTTYLVLGNKELKITKSLGMSGNHQAIIKAYDINGNFDDKENNGFNKITPILDSIHISQITQTGATAKSNIIDNGGDNISSLGFCISKHFNTTVSDSIINVDLINTGDFENIIQSLKANTQYYIRAFAINNRGVSYSNEIEFTTSMIPAVAPSIITKAVSSITLTSATSGGLISSDGGSIILTKGVCYATHANPTLQDSLVENTSTSFTYNTTISNLSPNTKYYLRAFATNAIGTSFGNELNFTTAALPVTLPILTTTAATSITKNSFRIGGTISSDGNSAISDRGICFSKSSNPSIQDSIIHCNTGVGAFDTLISLLSASTTYYVRAFATNVKGTAYGNEVTATTLVDIILPSVSTVNISSITYTSANSGGQIISDGGSAIISKGICYATSSNPTVSNTVINGGTGTADFTSNLTSLSPGQQYYVRAFATNNLGTSYGNEINFTTNAYAVPTLTTSAATNITQTTATIGGSVISDGGKTVTSRGVCYSLTPNPTILDSNISSGAGLGVFSSGLTDLLVDTTYYFKSFAINTEGINYGNELSFKTIKYVLASVTTNSTTNIQNTTATLNAVINNNGGSLITSRGFYYSTITPVTSNNATIVQSGSGNGLFNFGLTGLSPNTTYYVKSFAINNNGLITAYGNEEFFTTTNSSLPIVNTTINMSNVKYDTAIVQGNVTSDGGAAVIERGVCYSTSPNPTINDIKIITGSGTGLFSSTLSSLLTNKTYYARAYATNINGTSYGGEISFTTLIVAIGNYYQGGKVAYILAAADLGYSVSEVHGLIVLPQVTPFNSTTYIWSDSINNIYTSAKIGYGNSNTNLLISNLGTHAPAAKICHDLIANGYNDWYLPSKTELEKIKLTASLNGGMSGTRDYWSSTNAAPDQAYYLYHTSVLGYPSLKTTDYYVVPTRSF